VVNPIKFIKMQVGNSLFSEGESYHIRRHGMEFGGGRGTGHRAGWSELTKYTSSNTSSVKQEVE